MIRTTHLAIVIRLIRPADIDQQERTRLRSRLIADVTQVQRGFHVVAMRMRSHELLMRGFVLNHCDPPVPSRAYIVGRFVLRF